MYVVASSDNLCIIYCLSSTATTMPTTTTTTTTTTITTTTSTTTTITTIISPTQTAEPAGKLNVCILIV